MKNLLYTLVSSILIFLPLTGRSQQINWMQINSNNIVNIIDIQSPNNETYTLTTQMGNFNDAQLFINDKTSISLQQTGEYNRLFFINLFTELEVKTSITTQGYNNMVDITGSNSISDNMRMNVKGDNMTIFMRNY